MAGELSFKTLKARHRRDRDAYPLNLNLRVHRALSWLDRAEKSNEDRDSQFIFLWIAFNAAYAQEYNLSSPENSQDTIFRFFRKISKLDKHNYLYDLIWTEYTSSIRLLLKNPYIHRGFWDISRGKITKDEWKVSFKKDNEMARKALQSSNTPMVLKVIFHRLYTLRNQLVHGGATWNGQVNREQIRDSSSLMSKLVPVMILIMMENPGELWGDPSYPVVE